MDKVAGPKLPPRPQRKPSKPSGAKDAAPRLPPVPESPVATTEVVDLPTAMAALANGERPDILAHMSNAMQLPQEALQKAAAAVEAASRGEQVSLQDLPPALVQRAAEFQRAAMAGRARAAVMAPPGAAEPADKAADDGETGLLEDEDSQQWLSMYRVAYGKHADAVLGPVFTALVAALFWAGVLPFWAALVLLPPLLLVTVHLVLVKGFRFTNATLPMSRLPCGVVSSWEAAAMGTFLVAMLPTLRDVWGQALLLVALSSAAYYLHYLAATTDPGVIPAQGAPPVMPPEDLAALQAANPYFCLTCNVYKPIRSRHCAVCGCCRPEHDHHCPVVANCVGVGNRRCFAGYLVTLLAAELLWMRMALLFHRRLLQARILHTPGLPPWWAVVRHLFALGAVAPGATYATVLVAGILVGTAYLAWRQMFCVAANLTVQEWVLRRRYDYLKAGDELFYNPFDLGPAANCAQFWRGGTRPDWFGIYSQRAELDPGAAAPRLSVTRLLRSWDLARQALHMSRMARRGRREAWLLQQYGGAPGAGAAAEAEEGRHQHCGHACNGAHAH